MTATLQTSKKSFNRLARQSRSWENLLYRFSSFLGVHQMILQHSNQSTMQVAGGRWEQQSKPSDLGWTGLHPDLGAVRLGLDLPGPARILVLDCLYTTACDGKLGGYREMSRTMRAQSIESTVLAPWDPLVLCSQSWGGTEKKTNADDVFSDDDRTGCFRSNNGITRHLKESAESWSKARHILCKRFTDLCPVKPQCCASCKSSSVALPASWVEKKKSRLHYAYKYCLCRVSS